ncbi:uncharacterized protein [Anoplolepis gracilipes]|uniref:uncharacterized protein n=1 Tax=Anoplolepis gracilipes TaxID=354296 RepID=UPI003B9E4C9F
MMSKNNSKQIQDINKSKEQKTDAKGTKQIVKENEVDANEMNTSDILQPSNFSKFIESSNNRQDIMVTNKNDEMEMISFATDEMLKSVQLEDSTVEVIGFIDEIDGPKIVGKAQNYRLLKFILNNNSRHRIQVVVWNTEIERIQFHIKPNRIIHIDRAKAKKTKVPEFNQGTLPYELIIRSNTIISNLGLFDLKKIIHSVQPKLIELSNIPNHLNSCVLVRGYIKTRFNTLSGSFKTIGTGSITDGNYKLEIQIAHYEANDGFEKRENVKIKGYVKHSNDIFYLDVEKIYDIKLIEDQMLSLALLLQGTKPIMKRSFPKENGPSDLPTNKIIHCLKMIFIT